MNANLFSDRPIAPLQSYANVLAFFARWRLPYPKGEAWRLTPRWLGTFNALPGSRGILTATNGILAYVEREDGTLFLGHLEWFCREADATLPFRATTTTTPTRKRAVSFLLEGILSV